MQEFNDPGLPNPQPTSKGAAWRLQAVFFEPAALWDDIRAKPGFLIALILCIIISVGGAAAVYSKVDLRDIMEASIKASSAGEKMTSDQIREQVDQIANTPFFPVMKWAGPIIGAPIVILVVAGLMMLMVYLGGSESTFGRLMSVTTHAFFFYYVVYTALTVVIFFASSDPKAIDIQNPVMSNLGFLFSPKESPALNRLASSVDLITLYVVYLLGSGMAGVSRKMKAGSGILMIGGLYALYVTVAVLWRAFVG